MTTMSPEIFVGGKFANGAAYAAFASVLGEAANSSLDKPNNKAGYDTSNDAAMGAYKEYEELYLSLSIDEELTGLIYELDGKYHYSAAHVVSAAPATHRLSFNLPDGANHVANFHSHPVGGGLYFSGMRDGDAAGVFKQGGKPMYLRNEIGDVRLLTRENYDFFARGEGICGGAGELGCMSRHPNTQSAKRIINSKNIRH